MIIGITMAGPTAENRTSGSPKGRVVGGDRQVAQHDELAPAAEHMALHRRDHRLRHQPRRHLECELRLQMCVRLRRIAAPIVGVKALGADVVSGAEAAALGAQQYDARRGIGISALEGVGQRVLQLVADCVELVRPIKGNDADLIVNVVND
jgi:hypothetical protein